MLWEVVLRDGILFGGVRGFVLGGRVHTAKMLGEEVLAVEVVVVFSVVVVWIDGFGTQITAPEGELDVLCADVPFPLVLGTEVGLAPVGGERAGERAAIVCLGVGFDRAVRAFRALAGLLLGFGG